MMPKDSIIPIERSVIPACDVSSLKDLERIVKNTSNIEKIGGYKIGFELGLKYGFSSVVDVIGKYSDKPIIYDHQKAGTDIPDIGENFARICWVSGIDAVILFPQSGPETEKAWIEAAFERGLGVIVGGLMTHPKYLRSEGGYIADEAIMEMYLNAADLGVRNFVVPGNRPNDIKKIRKAIEQKGISPTFYAPGFIEQGGNLSEAAKAAGKRFHGIVGRTLCNAENIEKVARDLTSQI